MLVVVRPTDTVARLGGDEFMIVCEGLGESSVVAFCEPLGKHVAEPIATPEGDVSISGAIGIALVTGPATVDETIHQADAAMYRAKRAGSGSIELHPTRRPVGDSIRGKRELVPVLVTER